MMASIAVYWKQHATGNRSFIIKVKAARHDDLKTARYREPRVNQARWQFRIKMDAGDSIVAYFSLK